MSVSAANSIALLAPSGGNRPLRRDLPPAEQAHAAAAQFEAILVRQLIGDSVGKLLAGGGGAADGPGGAGGDQVYGYMLTDALAQKITEGGGLGLTRILEKQFTPKGPPPPAVKS